MTTPDTASTAGPASAAIATDADLWPFNRNTGILDRDLARRIRSWALSAAGGMTETELRSYSQRQCLHLYITRHLEPLLHRLLKPQRPPEVSEAGAIRAVLGKEPPTDRAELLLWQGIREMKALRAAEGARRARSTNPNFSYRPAKRLILLAAA
jgi:hypothetical protein